MKTARFHDARPADLLKDAMRFIVRWPKPLLQARPSDADEVGVARSFYGSVSKAEKEFIRHAGLVLDTPELDRRQLLLAGLAASLHRVDKSAAARAPVVWDIGGSTGLHRVQLESVLGPCPDWQWTVIETQAYCDAAMKHGRPGVRYFASIEQAAEAGLVPGCIYSNSALQYLDDPILELGRYAESGAHAVVFERVPLSRGKHPLRVLQALPDDTGATVTTPITISTVSAVTEALEKAGFHVALYRNSRAAFRFGWQFIDLYSVLAIKPTPTSTA